MSVGASDALLWIADCSPSVRRPVVAMHNGRLRRRSRIKALILDRPPRKPPVAATHNALLALEPAAVGASRDGLWLARLQRQALGRAYRVERRGSRQRVSFALTRPSEVL